MGAVGGRGQRAGPAAGVSGGSPANGVAWRALREGRRELCHTGDKQNTAPLCPGRGAHVYMNGADFA